MEVVWDWVGKVNVWEDLGYSFIYKLVIVIFWDVFFIYRVLLDFKCVI